MLYARISAKSGLSLALLLVLGLFWVEAPEFAWAQSILPARPEAPGGGNPLEGLGRSDDPNPSRATGTENDTANDTIMPPVPSSLNGTKGGDSALPQKRKFNSTHLIPPPSPVVMEGFSSADDKNPMKQAILHIGRKEYEKAQGALTAIINDDPENLKAIYLEAVVLVHRKKYLEAEKSYKKVLALSSDEDLKKMAELGLKKLDDMSSERDQ